MVETVRDLGRCWDSVGCKRRAWEEYREIMIEQFSTWNLDRCYKDLH